MLILFHKLISLKLFEFSRMIVVLWDGGSKPKARWVLEKFLPLAHEALSLLVWYAHRATLGM
jgi:hypothetical protein